MVVVAAGLFSIAGQVAEWVTSPSQPPHTHAFDETEFVGVALPFTVDYLSWDPSAREPRQAAISRNALPGVTVDGWDGTGRQWADSPAAVSVTRLHPDATIANDTGRTNDTATGAAAPGRDPGAEPGAELGAVVTVRVRVMPLPADAAGTEPAEPATTPDPAPTTTAEPGPSTGTGRPPGAPSSTSGTPPASGAEAIPNAGGGRWPGSDAGATQPRWLNLAVPLVKRGGRVVVSTSPALVGSAPTAVPAPAVPDPGRGEDTQLGRATREVITTLLATYGAGDLTYARAVGTSFNGLNTSATLHRVTTWRLATTDPTTGDGASADGAIPDGTVRAGDVTVVWALSGDAGRLRCSYRVELLRDTDRWYLASITPQLRAT